MFPKRSTSDHWMHRNKSRRWFVLVCRSLLAFVALASEMPLALALDSTTLEEGSQRGGKNVELKPQLEDLAKVSKSKTPEAVAAVMTRSLQDLKQSGIESRALREGDLCPDFALPDVHGRIVHLKELIKKGPAVIAFYRGGWCPYCSLTLRALEQSLSTIRENGGQLVAISPQKPDESLTTAEKDELTFDVLSDEGNQTARAFGLVFELPQGLVAVYKNFGIDLQKVNGSEKNELPVAATYVVDTAGKIRYAFVDADYKKRAEPSEIVKVLRQLSIVEAAKGQ